MSTWIECFKAGTQTDANGVEDTYTVDDLNTIVKVYKEALTANPNGSAKAPLCKGHPDDSAPAYGWVEDLKVEGDILMALVDPIKDFEEEVNKGMFKKVSISLYPDFMLRHIGFLGAVPPAVKGLDPVSFSRSDKYKTFDYVSFADPTATSVSQTVADYIAEQEARAKQYGIGVKDKIGYVQKPAAYSTLTDDQFGDPVNYLYPINDLPNLLASVATWSNWDNSYTAVEKQVVMARIYTAAQALQLKIEPEYGIRLYKEGKVKSFLEIPIDKLTKNQLTDFIIEKLNKPENQDFSLNNTGTLNMDEYLKKLIEALVAGVTSRVNADEGTALQADFDAFIAANPIPTTDTPPADPNAAPTFNEPTPEPAVDPKYAAYEARIAELEKINRVTSYNETIQGLVKAGKLLPKQAPIVASVLEFAHNSKGVMNFSENGKQVQLQGQNAVLALLNSYPNIHELSKDFSQGRKADDASAPKPLNFSAPKGRSINEDGAELYTQIINYQEEQKKAGRTLSFTEATREFSVITGGQNA